MSINVSYTILPDGNSVSLKIMRKKLKHFQIRIFRANKHILLKLIVLLYIQNLNKNTNPKNNKQ